MAEAPIFINTDVVSIEEDLVNEYQSQTGITVPPASVERLLFKTFAYLLSLTHAQVQDTAEQNLVDFARAPALDYLAANVGLTRLAATGASVQIDFTLISGHGGVTIPAGTRIKTSDGSVIFELLEDINVTAGVTSASGEAESQNTGSAGNGYGIGTVTEIMDPQAFLVSATNPAITGGGSDQESDQELRSRIKLAPASFSTAGPEDAYKFHAEGANPSIVDVAVVNSSPGVVDIYPLMQDGSTTPGSVITQVDEACNDLRIRPLCDTVNVYAPSPVNYNLTIDLTLFNDADGDTVKAAVTTAVNEYATEKRQSLGQDIVVTQLIAAAHSASELIYEVDLNGFTDLVINQTSFGLLGTLAVNVAGYTNG